MSLVVNFFIIRISDPKPLQAVLDFFYVSEHFIELVFVRLSTRVSFPESLLRGAATTIAMSHIAIQEQLDSKTADWMERSATNNTTPEDQCGSSS